MPADLLEKTTSVATKAAQVGVEVGRMKETVIHAAEDGMRVARRAVRRGRDAAEDLADDAARQIKKHPFESAGLVFGVGLGLGVLTGMLVTRGRNNCCPR